MGLGATPALYSNHFVKEAFAYAKHFDQLGGISHLA